MKNILLLGILLLSNNLWCQKELWNIDQKRKKVQIHAGDMIGYAKVIYHQGKRKKGRQILIDVIAEELNNTKIRKELHKTYAITAAENLIKIDYIEGIDYLLKLYRRFEKPKDTYSKRNYYGITNLVKNWTKRNYEPGYEIVKYLEEQLELPNRKEQLNANYKINQEIDSIVFVSFGMGGGFEVRVTKDSLRFQNGYYANNKVKYDRTMYAINDYEWNNLMKDLLSINLENINKLKSPTSARSIDGAYHSHIRIHKKGKIYKSATFDDFRPHSDIESLIFYLRYLMKNKKII